MNEAKGSIWEGTMALRILRPLHKGIAFKESDRLQQLFRSWDGDTEWRDVEVVVVDRDSPEWEEK